MEPKPMYINTDRQLHILSYAHDRGYLVWLELVGPSMGIDRLWAQLLKGSQINIVDQNIEPYWMQHKYVQFSKNSTLVRKGRRIEGMWTDHVYLMDSRMVEYDTRRMYWNQTQQPNAFLDKVRQIIKIPVFDQWHPYIWDNSIARGLGGKRLEAADQRGVSIVRLDHDPHWWTQLIAGGLRRGLITLQEAVSTTPG